MVQKKPHFKFVRRSCESGCLEIYESFDGRQVELVYACFTGSPKETPSAMRTLMENGRVIKRGWQRTKRGGRMERTVVSYPKVGMRVESVEIFLYRPGDLCFWYITAESLKLALEFERSEVAEKVLSE